MTLESLKREIDRLAGLATVGKIPTTDETGGRCWLNPGGAFVVVRESLRGGVDSREASLWSRAETDGEGAIFGMAKQVSIESLAGDKK